ncbi:MAG: HlyD family efflux transporter periplasmic adaptor subunit, partial [Thermoanaerobaculia bacterium]
MTPADAATAESADRRRPRRRTAILVAALALAAASAWGVARESLSPGSWTRVERRDLVIGIELEGELASIESADIGPPQIRNAGNFKISMMIPEGTEVGEGQPVLGFDATRLQQQLQQKVAERDQAEKELEKRTTDLEIQRRDLELQSAEAAAALRKADLKLAVPTEVVGRKELELARIDHRLAEMRIGFLKTKLKHLADQSGADLESLREKRDRATARVEEIRSHLLQMTVKAPRAGTVIYKTDWRGNKMKVGDSTWRGGKVLEIPDLSRMRAEAKVAEADAGRLQVGQRVTFRLDAYPDRQYLGTVAKIRRTVQRKSPSNPEKVVRLEIELEATDTDRMRPGMRLRGTIESERLEDAVVVPSDAVLLRPGATAVVRRTLFGRTEVFPTFGKRNDELFEVTSGLEEGDWVLRQDVG